MCTQGPLDSFWQLFSFPRFRSNSASSDRKRLLVNAALGQCPLPGIICYYDMNRHVWRSLHVNVLGVGRVEHRAGRGEQSNQERSCGGMAAPRTWRVLRCRFPGPGGWGENEKRIRRTAYRLPTACSIIRESQCSQHIPSLFAINKIWIIRSLRQEEEKKRKIFKDLTVDKKLTPLSSEMDLSFIGLDPYKLVCIDVCGRVWRSLKTKSI